MHRFLLEFVHFRKWHCPIQGRIHLPYCSSRKHATVGNEIQYLFQWSGSQIPKACGSHFPNPLIGLEVLTEERWQFLALAQQFVLRPQYGSQLYQGFQLLQQGHLKNSRWQIVKTQIEYFQFVFQFQEAHCHNDLGLKWLLFEVPQTYPRHEPRVRYSFVPALPDQKGLCESPWYLRRSIGSDFRYCQWLV